MRRLSSDERGLGGGSNVGRSPAPAKAPFIGAGAFLRGTGLSPELRLPVIVFPPASECWPELGVDAEAVLRRTRARRSWQRRPLACSGEDNLYGGWGFPPANALLTGVGSSVIRSPPVRDCWPELGADAEAVLRRSQPLQELGLSSGERASRRSCGSGNRLSSCERMLAGAGRG